MNETLEFIFQDFTHWIGTVSLIISIGISVAIAISPIFEKNNK